MKNVDVIATFIDGGVAKTKNLRVEDKFLYNYDTPLAQRLDVGEGRIMYVINATKYSSSTSAIQNKLLTMVAEDDILRVVTDIPMGANYLI
jgi:hypothetical protein